MRDEVGEGNRVHDEALSPGDLVEGGGRKRCIFQRKKYYSAWG